MSTPTFPRETREDLPFVVTLDGTPVTNGFSVAIYRIGEDRPTVYGPPKVAGATTSVLVDGPALGPGGYAVQVRYDDGAVRDIGAFTIT